MSEIFDKICQLRTEFRVKNITPPSTIYMNMADYRALCEWCKDVPQEIGKSQEILGMRIVKRAGEMECALRVNEPPFNDKRLYSSNAQDVLSAIDEIGKALTDLGMTHEESGRAIAVFIVFWYDNRHGYGSDEKVKVPLHLRKNADDIQKVVRPCNIEIGEYRDGKWVVIESRDAWKEMMERFRRDGIICRPPNLSTKK